jgi:hypothetical protein
MLTYALAGLGLFLFGFLAGRLTYRANGFWRRMHLSYVTGPGGWEMVVGRARDTDEAPFAELNAEEAERED